MSWVEIFLIGLFGALTGTSLGLMFYGALAPAVDVDVLARLVADTVREPEREACERA